MPEICWKCQKSTGFTNPVAAWLPCPMKQELQIPGSQAEETVKELPNTAIIRLQPIDSSLSKWAKTEYFHSLRSVGTIKNGLKFLRFYRVGLRGDDVQTVHFD